MAVHFSVYHGLWQYMAVHLDWICAGRGPPADFGALLKALHCMHHQWQLLQVIACTNSFIHPLVPLPAPPLTLFCLPAGVASAAAAASPAAGGTGVASREVTPPTPGAVEPSAGGGRQAAGGGAAAAGGTSAGGGEAAFEATVLVVMNGVGRFLVPDVATGDRVDDDEAEDVELHDTSCVCQFANRNDKFRINKPSNRHPGSRQ
jgi:hypothetical protein